MRLKDTLKIICFSFFLFHFSLLNAQSWLWGYNGIGDGWPLSIASDGQGNCYMTGMMSDDGDTIHFGSNTISCSANESNAFLVKLNKQGNVLWVKQTIEKCSNPTLLNSAPESVYADSFGNSYLAGNFVDTLFIGSTVLITSAVVNYLPQNTYIAKYGTNGNMIWAKQAICMKDSSFINQDGISVDKSGNIYEAGGGGDSASIGSIKFGTSFSTVFYMFLAKYDSNGNVKWVKQMSAGLPQTWGITNDHNSNIIIAGDFSGNAIFGSYPLSSPPPAADFFLAKYDSAGNVLWARQAEIPSTSSSGIGLFVVADLSGNVYVAGNFQDTLIFGKDTLISPVWGLNTFDFFLVKYDSNGNLLWIKQAKTKTSDNWEVGGLSIDNSKHLYLSAGGGHGVNEIEFGGDTLSMNDTAAFDGASVIFKLDSNGNTICSAIIPIGTDGGGNIPIVASDTSGNYVYLSGIAQSVSVFGEDTVNPFAVPGGHPFTVNGFPFAARWEECDSNVLYAGVQNVKPVGQVVLYPNPNNGSFTLALQNVNAPAQVEVYNMLGESIYKTKLNPTNTLLSLVGQPSGVYFYRVIEKTGELVGSGKMVIEK